MGNFYANYTVRASDPQQVAAALAGRTAAVTPVRNDCVVVFDAESENQDIDVISELASQLSGQLSSPVLAVLNHDDDVLWFQLYDKGKLSDEYNSAPSYFDTTGELSPPAGGDADKLCAAFRSTNVRQVETILRNSSFEEDGYVFALHRHIDLVSALGISPFAVGTGYSSLEYEEFPDDLKSEDIIRVS